MNAAELTPEEDEELANAEERLNAIEKMVEVAEFTDEQRAIAGCIITLRSNGEPDIHRGMVLREDLPKPDKQAERQTDGDSEEKPVSTETETAGYSAALVQDLTALRTAAFSAELAEKPAVALRVLAYQLARNVFASEWSAHGNEVIEINSRVFRFPVAEHFYPDNVVQNIRKEILARIPDSSPLVDVFDSNDTGTAAARWKWFMEADFNSIMQVLALCTALSCNTQLFGEPDRENGRTRAITRLQRALKCDNARMKEWISLTEETFWKRLNKKQLMRAWEETGKEVPKEAHGWKKDQLVDAVSKAAAESGWVPHLFRLPSA